MRVRRKDGKCSRCPAEARPNDAYCGPCAKAKYRENYLARKVRGPIRRNSNACNCGKKKCNGLMCERVSAIAPAGTRNYLKSDARRHANVRQRGAT